MFSRFRLLTFVVVAGVVLLGALHARPPTHATIEVGPMGGSFHQTAVRYRAFFAARGIDLAIRSKANSLEIMRDVADSGSGIDFGFEAQDVSEYKDSALFTAGLIQLQPLFVFASANLGRRVTLTDLRGRKIVMPPEGSATSDAAVRMFQLYDISPDNSTFSFMPLAEAARELRAGHFDAGAFMLAPENTVIRDLTAYSGLHLVPIAEAKAIANHLPFLRPVVLPRGIYDIADAIPPDDVPLLAGMVNVVIRKGLHPYLIYTLLDAMEEAHRGPTFISNAGAYPTALGAELPVHPLVQEWYRSGVPWTYRDLSPLLASFVDQYLLVGLAILLLGGFYRITSYVADASRYLVATLAIWMLVGIRRSIARKRRLSGPQCMLVRVVERSSRPLSARHRIEQLLAGIRSEAAGN